MVFSIDKDIEVRENVLLVDECLNFFAGLSPQLTGLVL